MGDGDTPLAEPGPLLPWLLYHAHTAAPVLPHFCQQVILDMHGDACTCAYMLYVNVFVCMYVCVAHVRTYACVHVACVCMCVFVRLTLDGARPPAALAALSRSRSCLTTLIAPLPPMKSGWSQLMKSCSQSMSARIMPSAGPVPERMNSRTEAASWRWRPGNL